MTKQNLEERLLAHTDLMYRISVSLLRSPQDREGAVQSALEIAWRKAGSLRDDSKLKPWLTRVMINACYGILRGKQRELPLQVEPEPTPGISSEALALREALSQLPDTQRLPWPRMPAPCRD